MAILTMVEVTGIDLVRLVQKAYYLSEPVVLTKELSESYAKYVLGKNYETSEVPVSLYYPIFGRNVKILVIQRGGRLWMHDYWEDHTLDQYKELLDSVGIQYNPVPVHFKFACEQCSKYSMLLENSKWKEQCSAFPGRANLSAFPFKKTNCEQYFSLKRLT
jgi:hypothetical protein